MDELDKDDNGAIDDTELATAPGLKAGASAIDTNKDGQLSREELETRFAMYVELRIGLKPGMFRVTYNNRPLPGAEVRLVPEFFLEGVIEPANGTTDEMGVVQPAIEDQKKRAVMRVGYYRVEVESSQVQLPAKFNSATTLGVELSPIADDPSTDGTIEIQLRDKKSKR